jgi:hemolysin activation/secretion protein
VKIFGIGYRIPLYAEGASLEVIGGYSDVNFGTVQDLFTVTGSGTIGALRYNQHLQRLTDYEHKIVYGVDYRAYRNRFIASGTDTAPEITVHPVSIFYSGIYRTGGSELNFYLYAAQNVFSGGDDAGDGTFKAPGTRDNAKAAYRLYRYQAVYSRVLQRGWQARALVSGQYSDHALIPGEQFGIGGADTVRGFLERELANDRGYRGSLELHSPDLGDTFGFKDVRARALAFFDTGSLRRNKALPGEPTHQSISSAGVGVRIAAGRFMSARLDFAQVLDGGGAQRNGDQRLHFSVSVVY